MGRQTLLYQYQSGAFVGEHIILYTGGRRRDKEETGWENGDVFGKAGQKKEGSSKGISRSKAKG